MEKIKALENSNENYIKEINEIKLKNEEYKNIIKLFKEKFIKEYFKEISIES